MSTGIADIPADKSNEVGVVSRIDEGEIKTETNNTKCATITTSPRKSSNVNTSQERSVPTADIKSNKTHPIHPDISAPIENGEVPLPNSTNVNIVTLQSIPPHTPNDISSRSQDIDSPVPRYQAHHDS